MSHIFISHTTADDNFVKELRRALEGQNLTVWVDSRNLRGGEKLDSEIKTAIADARAVIAVLSPATFNSKWVRDEIRHANQIEQQRSDDGYRVIPLLLPGVDPSALWIYFDEDKEPLAIKVTPATGGLSVALPQIIAAIGDQPVEEVEPLQAVAAQPVDDLILELRDPHIVALNGAQRASATATLVYQPADKTARAIESRRFTVTAPLGPIELEEIRWYLEQFSLWPVGVFAERAHRTEAQLPEWGKALYAAALDAPAAQKALGAWRNSSNDHARRFSVWVDRDTVAEADEAQVTATHLAATELLALPWELLHDDVGFVLHGANPVRIRRRLPNRKPQTASVAALPIRILLLSPRPELGEDGKTPVGYIDHRASALSLVAAVENLGEMATVTVLHPPTLPALQTELQRAKRAATPYDVVHFDGHGVYDRRKGLGALLFEAPQDAGKLGQRRSQLVHADKMAGIMRDYGIPLVFLDACQSGQSEEDLNSVATRLLEEGVTSVAAMSYSVLVETARRYVQAFYGALATGRRVGAAHLAGQQVLEGDSYRIKVMGAGDLHMQDWFVPVLYQDEADPQLFGTLLPQAAQRLQTRQRTLALGALPKTPEHTFIGRSRELLRLERLLEQANYALVRGTGGAGKTTLAVELARWLLRNGRFQRAAFVSLEIALDDRAVLDSLGRQLLPDGDKYSIAQYKTLDEALQPVARALHDDPTIIVIDNVETVLPETSGRLLEGASVMRETSRRLLALCQKLLDADPATRLVFTSRERLPAPFDNDRNRIDLGALSQRDAIALVERVMTNAGWQPAATDPGTTPQEVDALVNAVNRHARALVLLAPEVARRGVTATTTNLTTIMETLDANNPGDRENSLYASLELSLRRLPPEAREHVNVLAVFHGGAQLSIMAMVMEIEADPARDLAIKLIDVGLGDDRGYGYLRLDPALGPYLRRQLADDTVAALTARWAAAMMQLVNFLYQQLSKDARMAAQLTLLELPNLLALLDWLPQNAAPEQVVSVAGSIEQLLANLGRPGALARAVAVREVAGKRLGDREGARRDEWSHAHYLTGSATADRLLQQGDLRGALTQVNGLLKQALTAGETAFPEAAYDIAMLHWRLGRALRKGGQAEAALEPLAEAQRRFEVLDNTSAARMASVSLAEQAGCLRDIGRLDEAAEAYEGAIELAEKRDDARSAAVNSGQLGTVRMFQGHYTEALAAYEAVRDIFEGLGEPAGVAGAWHQIGMVHRKAGQIEIAERAYRKGLAIRVEHNLRSDQASSLSELGELYGGVGRLEEAVTFFRQSADIAVELGDLFKEGQRRSNTANTLMKLKRNDEARHELLRGIDCLTEYGQAAQPWIAYGMLHNLETAEGNAAAAQTAWQQARDAYLSYRRDGGYAQGGGGKLVDEVIRLLQADKSQDALQLLAAVANADEYPTSLRKLASGVQAAFSGNADPALADDTTLYYRDAAELLLLLERLTAAR